jgi:flavin-dependent dehydrogenase
LADADVLIIGAGPAGSATAWFLARAGARVLLIDRARFPRDKPCAEYLSPQASRILDEMGALAEIERAGAAQLGGMTVRSPSGDRFSGDFTGRHGFHGFRDRGLALRRRVLDAILLDRARAAGARVLEGVRIAELDRDARGRVLGAYTRDGASERHRFAAPLTVGADGLRSVVARRLGVTRTARWPRRIAFVAHYHGVQGLDGRGEMHVEREGYLGLAEVGGGETNVALVIPASRAVGIGANRAEYLERWIVEHPHLADRFDRARRVSPVVATGPFASAVRRAWSPGAALVGDAADFFDPFTGEGIYAALRGGEMLASYALAAVAARDARAADRALADYDRARRGEFGGKWLVERLVGTAVAFPPLMNRAARALARRKDMADLLIGVTGDFVPPREILRPAFLLRLLLGSRASS